ncbi:hypothetical protein H072_7679 [Dactylellina haptotyla CBS 200.50]|uniref:Uncharacterized protein n=1 Tax=Dactylellina haptotyla (strain CBS 200.50) TaxID=1284197 RepID=S8BTI5_DACHA|nr:hypothetical protein H072_7679 [Dactylellina haptotyla CBS 200.50]
MVKNSPSQQNHSRPTQEPTFRQLKNILDKVEVLAEGLKMQMMASNIHKEEQNVSRNTSGIGEAAETTAVENDDSIRQRPGVLKPTFVIPSDEIILAPSDEENDDDWWEIESEFDCYTTDFINKLEQEKAGFITEGRQRHRAAKLESAEKAKQQSREEINIFKEFMEEAKSTFDDFMEAFKNFIRSMSNAIESVISWIKEKLLEIFKDQGKAIPRRYSSYQRI